MSIIKRKFYIHVLESSSEFQDKCYIILQDQLPVGPPLAKFEDAYLLMNWLNDVAADIAVPGYDDYQNLHKK